MKPIYQIESILIRAQQHQFFKVPYNGKLACGALYSLNHKPI